MIANGSFGAVSDCIYHMRWPARRGNCKRVVGTSQYVILQPGGVFFFFFAQSYRDTATRAAARVNEDRG